MSSDDSTRNLPDETSRTTQPTITAVFELVRELKHSVDATNARLEATNARLEAIGSQHARDFAGLTEEVTSGFARLGDKMDALNRRSLNTDAEQSNILRRIRDLESKAS